MSCPLILEIPARACRARDVVAALRQRGIAVTSDLEHSDEDRSEYLCRRGYVSLALTIRRDRASDVLYVSFSADLSKWRWWNFPFLWLAGIFTAGAEIDLQRDAFAALRSFGPHHVAGGEVLGLRFEDDRAAEVSSDPR
ncbi:hypothetical protein [Polyangium jinanense]|uniref:Uncharacterized protein n=1 Tax=Polyangium jinanense TaxID=2829994 RepID=A0A9X4AT42_9BACT|nr:hypothetical protein [Polyangium jinanense]MDC3959963.1 hypothetical protein [Polyangium jinanense]MDC3983843.1 hypothetical protein [Polyangium jinanense]